MARSTDAREPCPSQHDIQRSIRCCVPFDDEPPIATPSTHSPSGYGRQRTVPHLCRYMHDGREPRSRTSICHGQAAALIGRSMFPTNHWQHLYSLRAPSGYGSQVLWVQYGGGKENATSPAGHDSGSTSGPLSRVSAGLHTLCRYPRAHSGRWIDGREHVHSSSAGPL
ncbi:hypothetical protein BC567DRAFT_218276 [Phyllosticta citribraziliensis]